MSEWMPRVTWHAFFLPVSMSKSVALLTGKQVGKTAELRLSKITTFLSDWVLCNVKYSSWSQLLNHGAFMMPQDLIFRGSQNVQTLRVSSCSAGNLRPSAISVMSASVRIC